MEQLALEVFDLVGSGSQFANMEPDASITITDTSEIFDSGDVWTHSFQLNIPANAHLFGTSGELHGSRLHEQINKRRARLWVIGLPLYYGYLRLEDEVKVDDNGNVDVSIESGQKTFRDMIDGAKANQVPPMSDVMIGMALWRKRFVRWVLPMTAHGYYEGGAWAGSGKVERNGSENIGFQSDGDTNPTQQYPRMVFPKGRFYNAVSMSEERVNCLNTDTPYNENELGVPTAPYCNVALCYQKQGYPEEDGKVDYSKEPEAKRGYEVMPANRVNSAPNFYVIYWLRSLMKYLGIIVEENQMMDVENMRRLFFVNTKCAYEEIAELRNVEPTERYGKFQFSAQNNYLPEKVSPRGLIDTEECSFTATNLVINEKWSAGGLVPDLAKVVIKANADVIDWDDMHEPGGQTYSEYYKSMNNLLHRAYATSECFPDEDIDAVIDMLENAFGIRFLFSEDYKSVRIALLRNLFRNQEVQEINCEVVSVTKKENSIRGFRMTFGAGNEDTTFYYKGFADMLPSKNEIWIDTSDKHDYSIWKVDAEYKDVINKVTAFNKTCYVCPATGNAYGIKVDKDGKRYDELHPSLFEFAGYMDAEDGDCTGEAETIKEINVGFKPAIVNDLNMEAERGNGDNPPVAEQRFALFVNEEMRPRRADLGLLAAPASYNDSDAVYDVDGQLYQKEGSQYKFANMMSDGIVQPGMFAITSDSYFRKTGLTAIVKGRVASVPFDITSAEWRITFDMEGHLNEGFRLYLQDNFEPNDDGISPIETHEWGITLGIMRGSGNDAYIGYSADPDETEGNDTWEVVPGSSVSAHPDICDDYGNIFDNGTNTSGTGYTGYQWGDKLLTDFGCQNQCGLKNRKGPVPEGTDVMALIDTYYSVSAGTELQVLTEQGYYAYVRTITDKFGNEHTIWLCCVLNGALKPWEFMNTYTAYLQYGGANVTGLTDEQKLAYMPEDVQEILYRDSVGSNMLIAVDPSMSIDILTTVCNAYLKGNAIVHLFSDDRVSLKLRAEKPNPYFDPTQPETKYDPEHPELNTNPRYLTITNPALRHRGLMDQFYKEYSYWVRNARIAKIKARIGLAELLSIDKTKKVRIGDITGFIKKMQYTVSNKTGLGIVDMEVWYL